MDSKADRQVIKEEFGANYTESGVWRLAGHGILGSGSLASGAGAGRTLPPEVDAEEWPKIQVRARRTEVTIFPLDGSCVQSQPTVRRAQVPERSRPEMYFRQGDLMRLTLISALNPGGTLSRGKPGVRGRDKYDLVSGKAHGGDSRSLDGSVTQWRNPPLGAGEDVLVVEPEVYRNTTFPRVYPRTGP